MTSRVLFEDGDDDITSTHYRLTGSNGEDVSDFGLCPECGKPPMIANVGRDHWGYCKDHKVAWAIGSNLFSSWRDQTEEESEANRRFLADFKVVEEFAPSDREVELETMGFIKSLGQDGNPFSQDAPEWMSGFDPNRPEPPVNMEALREFVAKVLQEAEELLSRRGHDVTADDVERIFTLGGEIRGISYVLASVVMANELLSETSRRLCERASAMAEVFGTRPVFGDDFVTYPYIVHSNFFGQYPAIGLGEGSDSDIPF